MRSSIIIGVEPSSLINFRGPLLKSMVFHGFTVTTLSKRPTCAQMIELKNMGVTNESVPFLRAKLSIFSDLKVLVSLVRKYKNIRPNIVLAYTIKPVIWGGIAARFLNTDFYALITGLGFAFQEVSFKRKILSKLVTFLYKLALKNSKAVIFQNKDNCDVFVSKGIVELSRAHVVNGSGVNLEKYNVENFPSGSIKFLCISRLLGEKGLREYAEAAKIVKNKFPDVGFDLVGPEDSSPDAIPLNEVDTWSDYINYKGSVNDVRPHIEGSHVYVLPSYHEGLPRSVLEAMSMGRPIITTDAPGCCETVADGDNGFLVPVKAIDELVAAMLKFIKNPDLIARMGTRSRQIAEEKYDENKVNEQMLKAMGIK